MESSANVKEEKRVVRELCHKRTWISQPARATPSFVVAAA